MIFKPRHKRKSYNIYLLLNDQQIDQVKETVFFLGVLLDENLTWKLKMSHLANQVSKSLGIIHKSSFSLWSLPLRALY